MMTHRSECFARKTESSVAVNAEADTTAGGWAIVYEEMALVGADGTEYPLYTGQSSSRAGRRSAWKLGRTIDNDIAVIIAALRGRASSETSIGRLHDDNLVCRDARFEHSPLSFCKCSRPGLAAIVIFDDEAP
jgi:hypothetical protein